MRDPTRVRHRSQRRRGRQTATRSRKLEAFQVTAGAPLGDQVTEGVEARRVKITEERTIVFRATLTLVVVIARGAGHLKGRVIDREFGDRSDPAVLALLTGF